ncbi:putative membrane protein [Francisella philomiragia]|uniref:hypothetical protein n=1 Tax=Francisella philomiragia TaxID=28110 RepID=UPI0005A55F1A|nr:hypothetical protein [Francisella philomiragia]AJI55438.1 putative membrane protein [Francisella philomiragia]MBK2252667.1 hypothetical protein [Francisella philomiragia]
MKGVDIILFWIILIVSFFIGYYIFDTNYNGYSDIVTFLSIMIGFKITSLSILFNSPLKKTLYDRKNIKYGTELHRLKAFYEHSLYFDVVSVVLLFLIVSPYKYIIVLPIIFGSIYCFYRTSKELLKIFVYPTNEK